ncbi:hypothetical protein BHM03_00045433 [Ensete ventricosum]|nr:hypothetical protein BHM03_00045433 [Ensete ventricosum]
MVRVRFTSGPKGDLGVTTIPRPFFHRESSVSFSGQGAVSPRCRSVDDDVYLQEAWEQVAPAYPFFWKSPWVVPRACHFMTSYDLPAFLPPEYRQLHTGLPIATSLVPCTAVARSTTRRIGRAGASLRMLGLPEKDVCQASFGPPPQICRQIGQVVHRSLV